MIMDTVLIKKEIPNISQEYNIIEMSLTELLVLLSKIKDNKYLGG